MGIIRRKEAGVVSICLCKCEGVQGGVRGECGSVCTVPSIEKEI